MNQFQVGETVEYHPSEWMQREAGCRPIELVEIQSIDRDGGIAYRNDQHRGHVGYARVPEIIKKLDQSSMETK